MNQSQFEDPSLAYATLAEKAKTIEGVIVSLIPTCKPLIPILYKTGNLCLFAKYSNLSPEVWKSRYLAPKLHR